MLTLTIRRNDSIIKIVDLKDMFHVDAFKRRVQKVVTSTELSGKYSFDLVTKSEPMQLSEEAIYDQIPPAILEGSSFRDAIALILRLDEQGRKNMNYEIFYALAKNTRSDYIMRALKRDKMMLLDIETLFICADGVERWNALNRILFSYGREESVYARERAEAWVLIFNTYRHFVESVESANPNDPVIYDFCKILAEYNMKYDAETEKGVQLEREIKSLAAAEKTPLQVQNIQIENYEVARKRVKNVIQALNTKLLELNPDIKPYFDEYFVAYDAATDAGTRLAELKQTRKS